MKRKTEVDYGSIKKPKPTELCCGCSKERDVDDILKCEECKKIICTDCLDYGKWCVICLKRWWCQGCYDKKGCGSCLTCKKEFCYDCQSKIDKLYCKICGDICQNEDCKKSFAEFDNRYYKCVECKKRLCGRPRDKETNCSSHTSCFKCSSRLCFLCYNKFYDACASCKQCKCWYCKDCIKDSMYSKDICKDCFNDNEE